MLFLFPCLMPFFSFFFFSFFFFLRSKIQVTGVFGVGRLRVLDTGLKNLLERDYPGHWRVCSFYARTARGYGCNYSMPVLALAGVRDHGVGARLRWNGWGGMGWIGLDWWLPAADTVMEKGI